MKVFIRGSEKCFGGSGEILVLTISLIPISRLLIVLYYTYKTIFVNGKKVENITKKALCINSLQGISYVNLHKIS